MEAQNAHTGRRGSLERAWDRWPLTCAAVVLGVVAGIVAYSAVARFGIARGAEPAGTAVKWSVGVALVVVLLGLTLRGQRFAGISRREG